MRVKICGITNLEDALIACEAGADALGFVFYKPSPRFIEPVKAKEIIKRLPPFVERVGLFVNVDSKEINEVMEFCKLSTAQIHFEVNEQFLDEIRFQTLAVIRAKTKDDIQKFNNRYKIVDAFVDSYGGEGKRLNLEWFKDSDNSKIILAGGLKSDILQEVKKYHFYGVDVSSGVEKEKGKKDHKKVSIFLQNAKK